MPGPVSEKVSPQETQSKYQRLRLISRGGVASVHLAIRNADGREVAIKTFNRFRANSDPQTAEKIVRQLTSAAEIWSRLHHPHLVELYEILPNNHGIVMEYLTGETLLHRILKTGRIPPQEALTYFIPILDALDYMHGEGVTHNDLKLSNIILHKDNNTGLKTVKIIDSYIRS